MTKEEFRAAIKTEWAQCWPGTPPSAFLLDMVAGVYAESVEKLDSGVEQLIASKNDHERMLIEEAEALRAEIATLKAAHAEQHMKELERATALENAATLARAALLEAKAAHERLQEDINNTGALGQMGAWLDEQGAPVMDGGCLPLSNYGRAKHLVARLVAERDAGYADGARLTKKLDHALHGMHWDGSCTAIPYVSEQAYAECKCLELQKISDLKVEHEEAMDAAHDAYMTSVLAVAKDKDEARAEVEQLDALSAERFNMVANADKAAEGFRVECIRLEQDLADWKRNGHIYLVEIIDKLKAEIARLKDGPMEGEMEMSEEISRLRAEIERLKGERDRKAEECRDQAQRAQHFMRRSDADRERLVLADKLAEDAHSAVTYSDPPETPFGLKRRLQVSLDAYRLASREGAGEKEEVICQEIVDPPARPPKHRMCCGPLPCPDHPRVEPRPLCFNINGDCPGCEDGTHRPMETCKQTVLHPAIPGVRPPRTALCSAVLPCAKHSAAPAQPSEDPGRPDPNCTCGAGYRSLCHPACKALRPAEDTGQVPEPPKPYATIHEVKVSPEVYSTSTAEEFARPAKCPDLAPTPPPEPARVLYRALRELTALVRGEAPALLSEDSGGDGTLSLTIDAALAAFDREGEK